MNKCNGIKETIEGIRKINFLRRTSSKYTLLEQLETEGQNKIFASVFVLFKW